MNNATDTTLSAGALPRGMMRAKECAAFLGIGKSTFWKWVKEGRIHKGTRYSSRCTVWSYEDLKNFLDKAQAANVMA